MAVAPTAAPATTPSQPTSTSTPTPTTTSPAVAAPESTPQPTEPTAESILPEGRVNTDADTFDDVDDGFLGTPQAAPDTPAISATTPVPAAQPPVVPGAAPVEGILPEGTPPVATPPVDGNAALEEYRKNAMGKLESYFALDQGAADELATDPVVAVPKLMAKVMFETIQATMQSVQHFLPQMIEQHTVRQASAKDAEDKFYGAWPKLDRKVHNDYIRQAAMIYRQMKPQATMDEVIRDVGAQAMVAFKIPVDTPRQPWQRNPAATQGSPPPHRPAAAAAPRTAPVEQTPKRNIFVEMANEFADGIHDDQ